MRLTPSQYAQAIAELSADAAPDEVSLIVENLIGLMRRRGEEHKLDAIVERLEAIDARKAGRATVTVTTAYETTKDVKDILVARARTLFPDKKIDLAYTVDADAIGGASFRTDEVLYDATLSGTLKLLKKSLLKA